MKQIILCSSNPILTKNLYGILRDDGYIVETIDHPASAIRMVMRRNYDLVIIDSEPFGLSAEDAAEIISAVAPDLPVLIVGNIGSNATAEMVRTPVNLEEFKQKVQELAA